MRNHLERPIQDSSGNLLEGSTVRLLDPVTGDPVPDLIYISDDTDDQRSNPWVTDSGVIDFYIDDPRQVDIEVTLTEAGGTVRTFKDVMVGAVQGTGASEDVLRKVYGAKGDGTIDDRDPISYANADRVGNGQQITFTPGTYRIGSDLTVTVPVLIQPGAVLAPDTGVTLTLGGIVSATDFTTVFGGAGRVALTRPQRVDADWWGGKGTSAVPLGTIQKAITNTAQGSTIRVAGKYWTTPIQVLANEDTSAGDLSKSLVGIGGPGIRGADAAAGVEWGAEIYLGNNQNADLLWLNGTQRANLQPSRFGFTIDNIKFNGNKAQNPTGGSAVRLSYVKDVYVGRILCEYAKNRGFQVSTSSNQIIGRHIEAMYNDSNGIDISGLGDSHFDVLLGGVNGGVGVQLGGGTQVNQIHQYLNTGSGVNFSGDNSNVAMLRVNDNGQAGVVFAATCSNSWVGRCYSVDNGTDTGQTTAVRSGVRLTGAAYNNRIDYLSCPNSGTTQQWGVRFDTSLVGGNNTIGNYVGSANVLGEVSMAATVVNLSNKVETINGASNGLVFNIQVYSGPNAAVSAAAAAGGGVVYFPAGVWTATGQISLPTGVTLQGDPGAILRAAPATTFARLIDCAVGATDIAVRGLVLDANAKCTSEIMRVNNNERVLIEGNTFLDTSVVPRGLQVNGGSGDSDTVTVQRNRFDGCQSAVQYNGGVTPGVMSHLTISRNKIKNWTQRAIYVTGTATCKTVNLLIEKNRITDLSGLGSSRYPIRVDSPAGSPPHIGVSIIGNYIKGKGTAYTVDGTADQISVSAIDGLVISRNYSLDSGDGGLAISAECRNVIVSDNVIERPWSSGMWLGGNVAAPWQHNIVVTGNTITDINMGALPSGIGGIRAQNVQGSMISGNMFASEDTSGANYLYAVSAKGCTDVTVGPNGMRGLAPGVPLLYSESGNTNLVNTNAVPTTPNVQSFTTAGTFTWTKPAGAVRCEVIAISAGGGGGSGRRGPAGAIRAGGGGGAGGARVVGVFNAADLGATENLVVGTGGVGGTAVTADATNGVDGGAGGASYLGSASNRWLVANIAGGGSGGPAAIAAGGTAAIPGGSVGGAGSSTGLVGTTANNATGRGSTLTAGAGGGGGGITTAEAISAGGTGALGASGGNAAPVGGTAGGGNGTDGNPARTNSYQGGGGAAGGGSSLTTAGGKGGNGASPGGGGGGGGATLNGFNSGAGGNGGDGAVYVTTYFS